MGGQAGRGIRDGVTETAVLITTRALVERIPQTLKMIEFAPDENFRSWWLR